MRLNPCLELELTVGESPGEGGPWGRDSGNPVAPKLPSMRGTLGRLYPKRPSRPAP